MFNLLLFPSGTTGNLLSVGIFRSSALLWIVQSWWHPTPGLLPGKSRGRRSPVGCSPWGRSESYRTQRLHLHFSPSCIGEGNGNPLQHSCLENPRDRRAWWAAVYGVAQSRTRLKRLSSSSSKQFKVAVRENVHKAAAFFHSRLLLLW